jgi:hypothetical protein
MKRIENLCNPQGNGDWDQPIKPVRFSFSTALLNSLTEMARKVW